MAFPANPSDLEVCFAYGANLDSDLTTLTYGSNLALTHVRPRIVVARGRIGAASRTQPTSVDFGLKNPNGIFSPRNITGPHYGQLRRNTPVRVRLDPGGGMVTRGIAYLPDWPVRWTGPDIDDRIAMQASGALRRLGTGQESKSALKRAILAARPVAYWPLEDANGAASGASAVGGPAMTVTSGEVTFGTVNDLVGASTAPGMSDGFMATWVPAPSATFWHAEFSVKPGTDTLVAVARIYTKAAADNVWRFFIPNSVGSNMQIYIDDAAGIGPVVSHTFVTPAGWVDTWHHIGVSSEQSGGNSITKMYIDGVLRSTQTTAVTQDAPTLMYLNHNLASGSACASYGHIVFGDGPIIAGYYDAMTGHLGEPAGSRFTRLCEQEGIAYDISAGTGQQMGPQRPGAIVDLLRECEDSDEAVIEERLNGSLGFDHRAIRYNRAVTMTLNYPTQVAELLPDDDDRDLLNYVTVERIGGSSGTVERVTGPLGTDKTTGVDRYPDRIRRSLDVDTQAVNHAGWLVNLGTVDEPRYVVEINLRAHPELITQWLACDIGSRIQVTNPPAIQTGPAPLDLIIEGYVELLDGVEWYVTIYTQPYRPYEVFQIGTGAGNRSRIAAGVSTTDLAYSATATSLSVTSASVRWIDSATYASKFPIVIEIAGEVMTCTSITGTGLTQTFVVTRGLHGVTKALPITSRVQIYRPAAIAL